MHEAANSRVANMCKQGLCRFEKSTLLLYHQKLYGRIVEVAAVGCRSLSTIEATSEATSKAGVVRF